MSCRFCDIIQGKVKDYIIWENDNFVVLLNIKRTIKGTCMIIPKKHVDYLFDLDDKLYHELFSIAKNVSSKLKESTNAKRIGLFLSGFEIPHAHLFLLPLNKHCNFISDKERNKLTHEELLEMQNNLKQYF